ncbi:MAG: hypothetical protein R3B54_10940 [Bdellovibrionota bacterium]
MNRRKLGFVVKLGGVQSRGSLPIAWRRSLSASRNRKSFLHASIGDIVDSNSNFVPFTKLLKPSQLLVSTGKPAAKLSMNLLEAVAT